MNYRVRFRSSTSLDSLMHYGVKGQKWDVRRYQNEDGTLTDEGKRHYGVGEKSIAIKEPMGPKPDRPGGINPNVSNDERAQREKRDPEIDTEQIRRNLKVNYTNIMLGNIRRFITGKIASKVGTAMQLASKSPRMKTVGSIIGIAGKVQIASSAFRSVAATGAYFIGKGAVKSYEDEQREKKLYD